MRSLALMLFLFATVFTATAAETNYTCVVCGRPSLTGRIWISHWGAVCDACYRLENRCSLCGLPVRDRDDFAKTGDGRFICRFDRPDTVLDAAQARDLFADTQRELLELFGRGFALNYPAVTVNLFDVDYWSEKGRENGLHKFGFSSTRPAAGGACTHEVVLLSGRRRAELALAAAHEYAHLWINENLAPGRRLDADTLEAICELAAYRLMDADRQPAALKRILENPYTHGKINALVALADQRGIAFILNWVKNGTTSGLDFAFAAPPPPAVSALPSIIVPPTLPARLSFTGLSVIGTNQTAIVNGVSFEPGDRKSVALAGRTVRVTCRNIVGDEVLLESNAVPVTLKLQRK